MTIKEKNLKLIMELIFIFILPLSVIGINCKLENEYVYDNNGNFETSQKELIYSGIDFVSTITNNEMINEYFDIIVDYSDENYVYYTNFIELNDDNRNIYNVSSWGVLLLGYDDQLSLIETHIQVANGHIYYDNFNVVYIKVARLSSWQYISYATLIDKIYYSYENAIIINSPFVNFKNMVAGAFNVDNTDISFNIIFDYTCLWFLQFVIWHLLYGLFDFLMHLVSFKKKE